jgi:hypothetical protein
MLTMTVAPYFTTKDDKGHNHNYRMPVSEFKEHNWNGESLESMRFSTFRFSDMIDPTTAAILAAYAKGK